MCSTESGIISSVNELPLKAYSEIYFSDSGSLTDLTVLFSKHPPETEVMLSGNVISSGRSLSVPAGRISISVLPMVRKVILSSAFCFDESSV